MFYPLGTAVSPTDPVVSVCLRVFNGERYLAQAIESILTQQFSNFELVIINDGSTDGSAAIIASFDDPRIRLIDQENSGLSRATIRSVEAARGKFLAIMDADDISEPDRLLEQVGAFDKDPTLVAVGSNLRIIDEGSDVIAERRYPSDDGSIREALLAFNPFAHPSMMFRTRALRESGSYSSRFATVEDYELYFRLLRLGTGRNIERPLLRYRIHGGSVKSKKTKLQLRETIELRAYACRTFGLRPSLRARCVDVVQRALLLMPAGMIAALFGRVVYTRPKSSA